MWPPQSPSCLEPYPCPRFPTDVAVMSAVDDEGDYIAGGGLECCELGQALTERTG